MSDQHRGDARTGPEADRARELLERELAAEQAHVDRVHAALQLATRSARQVRDEGNRLFSPGRMDYYREEDGTALFERDAFAYQSARRLAQLDSEHEGLVFGRLDLVRDGLDEVRHIGRIGVRDQDFEPLVMDWRAPASEPFYRATPRDPMGVVRRRVLRSRRGQVVGIEDDLLDDQVESDLPIIGEGALMAALSRSRGDAMRDIVATIQAEQDEAIRAPYQGVTIISGGPGTGKTVVALHRAAFLLYTHRRRFENGGVLVVGPSALFMNYIERVLPSLGESEVTLRPIGQVAADVLGLRSDRTDPPATSLVKGSLRMLEVLKNLVLTPMHALTPLRVSLKGEILTISPEQAARLRLQVLEGRPLNRARAAAEQALVQALWNQARNESEVPRAEFDDLVTSQASFTMFMHAWWPSLSATTVLLRLADRALLDQIAPSLSDQERDLVAESYAALAQGYDPDRPRETDWTVADIALLDELVHRIGLPEVESDEPNLYLEGGDEVAELVSTQDRLSHTREVDPDADPQETFAHVLVDEAQDITPMQWRMLRRRGPSASWTLVGDPAQTSYPVASETRRAIQDLIGNAPSRTFRLSTNYRSPAEVFTLAAKVITPVAPDADLPAAVRSTGVEPVLARTTPDELAGAVEKRLDELLAQVEGTVGLICPQRHWQVCDHLLADLPGHERVRLVSPLGAKGLEYDGVLVLDPDAIVEENPGRERVLYVALTRPTQRLVCLDVLAPDAEPVWSQNLELERV